MRAARGTPPFGGFYETSVPVFQERKGVQVEEANLIPSGMVTAKILHSLANKLNQIERLAKQPGGQPSLRLIQSEGGRVTAFVQTGQINLKLALRRKDDEWIILGDALKVSD